MPPVPSIEKRDRFPPGGPTEPPQDRVSHTIAAGIVICLVLFITLMVAFHIVSKWRKAARTPTREERGYMHTFERWAERIAGQGKSERLARATNRGIPAPLVDGDVELPPYSPRHDQNHDHDQDPPHAYPRPGSSLSGVTFVERDEYQVPDYVLEPAPPPAVHFSYRRAERNELLDVGYNRAI